jgi:hypothetical protein
MSEAKDQPKQEATESKKEVGYSDGFGEAWERFVTVPESETKPEQKAEAKGEETPCDSPPCIEARRAKEQEGRKPIGVLKVQGKEVPYYSNQELIDLAQMGVDYTKKRQADSADRQKWEGEFQTKHDELDGIAEKFNKIMATLKPGEAIPGMGTSKQVEPEPVSKKSIYEEYGIDPEYADEYQKKMINDVVELKKKESLYDAKLQRLENMTNMAILKESMGKLGEVIKQARTEFPIDEIMSEDGSENLTMKQFVALLKAKDEVARGRGQTIDINEIARETIRDMHYIQGKAKQTAAPDISNEMNEDEFMAKYPDLAKRLTAKIGTKAVAEHEVEDAKLPPSLETKRREVDLSGVNTKKPETTSDWIDKGFEDPEVLAAFRGD